MHLSPRFLTTAVASLGASPRLGFALRISTPTPTPRVARRSASTSSDGGGETGVVSAAMHFLEDKKRLVDCLSPEDYAAVDAVVGASIGGHLRHTLDHFSKCLLAAAQPSSDDYAAPTTTTVAIRYDHRVRGGSIETDPAAASKSISSLLQQLQTLPRDAARLRAKRVAPTFMLGGGGRVEHEFDSNLERELFFCCHHGTHHDAMIQLILRRMGEKGEVALSQAGKGFGVAPSTIDFLKKQHQEQAEENERRRD